MPTPKKVTKYSDIDGWFFWSDRLMFDAILDVQNGSPGTLVELGAYLGRSAVIIGDHQGPDERFVIVDLFGSEEELGATSEDEANRRENTHSYWNLNRAKFDSNYLALHPELPEVVQGLSTEVVKHVEPGTARFMHIDASHLYTQVAEDIANAKLLLRDDGVVVLDDYRSAHTPGVAAATWAAVLNDGLVPFAITPFKLYGTWGDPTPYNAAAKAVIAADARLFENVQVVHGHQIVRLHIRKSASQAAAPVDIALRRELKDSQARVARLERQIATMRPARKPLRKVTAKDVPEPLRPALSKVWHALPASARSAVRRKR